jgi:hypothetical protein
LQKVDQDLPAVLEGMEEWRGRRVTWTITAAIQARCFALDIYRDNESHGEALIDTALTEYDNWSKADFIGCCVLLIGCAKCLVDALATAGKRDKCVQWIGGLQNFLKQEGPGNDDILARYHAAVCGLQLSYNLLTTGTAKLTPFLLVLANLIHGPRDETCAELFAWTNWCF